ncbi:hypothetical protein FG386_001538 [Cryptosporidium ryanae]|uniref:uncharacterized protein n=1 Tax=Cryptosporidium ryanae TaxID=515981 RepID=UPI003519F64C|nr:hypothetical protein FG386_001538 [Cryptosporidium ryanae]
MFDNAVEVYSLPQLQDRIKRDPGAYLSDFELQLQHFYSTLDIFRLNTQNIPKDIFQLMIFIAQTSPYYSRYGVCNNFIEKLVYELKNNATIMTSEMRVTMVTSLTLLSNQKIIDIIYLLPLWFDLMRLPDKNLRSKILKHIVTSIVDANRKKKSNSRKKFKSSLKSKQLSTSFPTSLSNNYSLLNSGSKKNNSNKPLSEFELRKYNISAGYDLKKFNTTIISFLRERINDSKDNIRALTIFIEVYRQNIWNNAQTVNIIASCCTKQNTSKAVSISVNFLLGKRWDMEDIENSMSDDEEKKELENEAKRAMKSALLGISINSRKKKLEKARRILKKIEKKDSKKSESNAMIKSNQCIDLINDPQEFAEELFQRVTRHVDPFEIRQLIIGLISRLIERHKLILVNYYSFLGRYLSPNNKNVTNILAYLAQACHDLVPPQELSPIIKILMDNFVNECNRPELIVIGLNTIREICYRIPTVLDQDKLMDLSNFRNINNKGVSIAAKSLINLYRDIMPNLLHRSLLNKESALNIRDGNYNENSAIYGYKKIENTVSGTDLLMKYNKLKSEKDKNFNKLDKTENKNEEEYYFKDGEFDEYKTESEDEQEVNQVEFDSENFEEIDEDESEYEEGSDNENTEFTLNSGDTNNNIALDKILDQDEFKLIKKLRTRLEATKALGIKSDAKQDLSLNENSISDIENEINEYEDDDREELDEDEENEEDGSELDDLCRDIKKEITQNFYRKRKNKQQRIQSIMKGRENRETFKEKRIKGKLTFMLILILILKKISSIINMWSEILYKWHAKPADNYRIISYW